MKKMFCMLAAIGMMTCSCEKIRKENKKVVIPVQAMEVQLDTSASQHTYVGTVSADKSLTLSFETGGCIQRILVKEGQKVSKGQLLAELDNRTALNTYNAANYQTKENGQSRNFQGYASACQQKRKGLNN